MSLRTTYLLSALLASLDVGLPFVSNRSILANPQPFHQLSFESVVQRSTSDLMPIASLFSRNSQVMSAFKKQHHEQHQGELEVQKLRNVPEQVSQALPHIVDDEMPRQHSDFFSGLEYFAISTMDSDGRPWATILSAKLGTFIKAISSTQLSIKCSMSSDDPFVQALVDHNERPEGNLLFAGLGIDFSNRRRNKVAGVILEAKVTPNGASSHVDILLYTNENMGNCPKYITVRNLTFMERTPVRVSGIIASKNVALDRAALDIVSRASTMFLATKHIDPKSSATSDAGLNHRGGPPGFVRCYTDNGDTFLVIPDYSGNRFYQSLGNVQSDRVAGAVFPDFETGSMLHVTGAAENVFGEAAQHLMPRASLVTRIRVSGFVLVQGSLNLALQSNELLSPYNPPLRYLASELQAMGKHAFIPSADEQQPSTAELSSVRRISSLVSCFTFQLDRPLPSYTPGAYVILDLSTAIRVPYMHMNQAAPRLLNDDLVRTWTISSASGDRPSSVSCTIKRVDTGTISPVLHSIKDSNVRLSARVVGSGGEFSCFAADGSVPQKMLWIAGGIGITPFLAMAEGLQRRNATADIVWLFACRGDDLSLLNEIVTASPGVSVRGIAFLSGSTHPDPHASRAPAGWTVVPRRMASSDLAGVVDLLQREAFLCGPAALEAAASQWLSEAGLPSSRIRHEKFTF